MGLDRPIDITADQRKTLRALLESYLLNTEAWVYGSRVKWTSRPQSDLDLVVFATPEQERRVSDLREAFEESNLPFRVDLFVWDAVPEKFRKHIKRDHAVLVEREKRDVAGEWRKMVLGECIVINDSTYPPREAWPRINYLDTGNISENRVSEIQGLEVGKDKIPSRARRKVQPGDIVYSTVRPNQKHFGLLKTVPENFLVSTGFAVLKGNDGIADTGFIYWFLAQDHIVEYLHSIAENSTSAYPSIKPIDLEQLTLSLPPLPEQRAIAHILGTLDDKIELNRRMNETLEAMARALFKSWFVEFDPVRAKKEGRDTGLPQDIADLFPDRLVDSELGEIPEGWEVSTIGQEVDVVGGSTPNTKDPSFWNGAINWATPKDLSSLASPVLVETSRRITERGLDKISSGLLPRGTVLLSSRAPIGYLAIADVPIAISQGFIAMKCRKRLSDSYVWLWTAANMDSILENANGSTFQEISKTNFRPLPAIVPHELIRETHDQFIRSLYDRIVKNERESCTLASLRDALLPKLISGEIRIRHAQIQQLK